MRNVLIGGNNRGGLAIVDHLPDMTVRRYDPHWILADPKENRPVQMAAVLTKCFPTLRPQPFQMKVQEALVYSSDDDTIVLALDTLDETTETLEARLPSQRVCFQLVGRGPGDTAGTRLAFQGTICPQDHETKSAALLFLHALAGMSRAASSRRLTGPDPLTAAVLKPLREVVSRQTARHLAEEDREPEDLSGGPLSVCFGQTIYPLISVPGKPQDTHAQRNAYALEMAGEVPAKHVLSRGAPGGSVYLAVVIPEARAIHFIKVAQHRTGKRTIDGVTSFVSPRVQQQSKSAVFTD